MTAVRPGTTGTRPARAGSRRASAPPHRRHPRQRLPGQPPRLPSPARRFPASPCGSRTQNPDPGCGTVRESGCPAPARAPRPVPARQAAGAAGWTRAWRGRSTLMNALLFGVAPVTLAAVIVAAFLIVSPGQGSAASLGFKAGPPSTQQLTASAMATPSRSPSASPSAHKKKHPRATSSASPGTKTARSGQSAKVTPKPAHKVTPHNLGLRQLRRRTARPSATAPPSWWPATPTAGAAR